MIHWTNIDPRDATNITLPNGDTHGPKNEFGEECSWPWEPQQMIGFPMGIYHCNYCGAMCLAGKPHPDYEGI